MKRRNAKLWLSLGISLLLLGCGGSKASPKQTAGTSLESPGGQQYAATPAARQPSADDYMNKGIQYLGNNQPEQAIACFTEALKVDPQNAIAYLNRGAVYQQTGKLDKALADFNSAIAIKPDCAEAYNNIGIIFKENNSLDKAIEYYKKAISYKSDYAQAYYDWGNILMIKKNESAASAMYDKAIMYNQNYAEAYHNRGLSNLLLVASDTAKNYNSDSLNTAIKDFSKAIDLQPNYVEAYNNRAFAYYKAGRYAEAKQDLNKVRSLGYQPDPELDGKIRGTQGQIGSKGDQIHGGQAKALVEQAFIFLQAGNYVKTAEVCQEAIRFEPDNAAAYAGLGMAYCMLGRYQESEEALKQAIRLKPGLSSGHFALGETYYRTGRYQAATIAIKQAIRLNPQDAQAHHDLGLVYLRLGDRGAALEEYKVLQNLDQKLAKSLFDKIDR